MLRSLSSFFEPEPRQILERLLPVYVETELYRALLESAASEQGAVLADLAEPAATPAAGTASAPLLPPPSPQVLLAVPPDLQRLLREKVTFRGSQDDRLRYMGSASNNQMLDLGSMATWKQSAGCL